MEINKINTYKKAISKNDWVKVKELIKENENLINIDNGYFFNSLIKNNHLEMIKYILDKNASIILNDNENHKDMLKIALNQKKEHAADLILQSNQFKQLNIKENNLAQSYLIFFIDTKYINGIKYLVEELKMDISIEYEDFVKKVIRNTEEEISNYFFDIMVNKSLSKKEKISHTVFTELIRAAVKRDNVKILEQLLDKHESEEFKINYASTFMLAAVHGGVSCLELLFNKKEHRIKEILYKDNKAQLKNTISQAIMNQNMKLLELLKQYELLHLNAEELNYFMSFASQRNKFKEFKFIVDQGADLNTSIKNSTIIQHFTKAKNIEAVKYIIENGYNIKIGTRLVGLINFGDMDILKIIMPFLSLDEKYLALANPKINQENKNYIHYMILNESLEEKIVVKKVKL